MTTVTSKKVSKASKEVRSIDLANDDLVKGLSATLNEKAQGEWFEKAVKMLSAQAISIRGLKATIEKAENSTWLKPSHVQYFATASIVRDLQGGKEIALKKVITITQDAKRAYGDKFMSKVTSAKSFKTFADAIPPRETKTRGEGKETSAEKELTIEGEITADSIVALALGLFQGLEDVTITNLADARILQGALNQAIKSSEELKSRSQAKHPTSKAKAA